MSKKGLNINDSLSLINLWLDHGIDLSTRRIEIRSPINENVSSLIVRSLIKMADIDTKLPIEMYLSSEGGDAHEALAIYDAIRSCPCPVNLIGSGKLLSAGFIIFLAGDKRVASANTTFMIHNVSYELGGNVKDHEIELEETQKLNDKILDILAERCKPSKKWWKKNLTHDKYFDINEALKYNIVTEQSHNTPKENK